MPYDPIFDSDPAAQPEPQPTGPPDISMGGGRPSDDLLAMLPTPQEPSGPAPAQDFTQSTPAGHDQRREALRNLLGNFLFALGQGMQVQDPKTGAPGVGGFGAAVAAPFQLQKMNEEMDLRRAQQRELESRSRAEEARANAQAAMLGGTMAKTQADIERLKSVTARNAGYTANIPVATAAKLAKIGYRQNKDTEELEPIPENELPAAEKEKILVMRNSEGYRNALKNLATARADLARAQSDPNSLIYQERQKRLQIAQQNANTAAERLGLTREALNLSRQRLGLQEYKADEPTNPTRTMAEMARTIQPKFGKAEALINKLDSQGKLGPVMGRFNEFMASKWGSGDPGYAELRSVMGMLKTAAVRAHFGARGGEKILERFDKYINEGGMDRETLNGAMAGIKEFIDTYAGMDTAEQVRNKAKRLAATGGGKTAPAGNTKDPLGLFK